MLKLENDWDGEGSPGYAEATWRRAIGLLVDSASRFWHTHRKNMPPPLIMKGPDGSVDLLWKSDQRQILVNIPADPAAPVTFYGHDRKKGTRTVEGRVDLSEPNAWLLLWLTE